MPQDEVMVGRAPEFARDLARATVEAWARERSFQQIDPQQVEQAMRELLPEKMRRGTRKEQ